MQKISEVWFYQVNWYIYSTILKYGNMALLTVSQMKKKVGDSWALIANPEYSKETGKLVRAELLFFDKDKEKVYNEADKCTYKHIGFFYFGQVPKEQIYIL
jgi:hypothetical protein